MPKRVKQPKPQTEKNPAAVLLGRLGGLKGGKARMATLTAVERTALASKAASARLAKLSPEERSALARKAVLARWNKKPSKKNQTNAEVNRLTCRPRALVHPHDR